MKVRYFIEYALEQDADGRHYYRPIGIWARGEGPWELTILYLPDAQERQWAADLHYCAYIERGDEHLPDDLLEQWCERIPLYTGDCSPSYMTAARNSEEVAMQVLGMIQAGKLLGDPPLPDT